MAIDRSDKTKQRSIVIVDDHPLLCSGLRGTIEAEADFVVVGEARTMHDAVKLVDAKAPDLSIIDITLQGNSGLELMKQLVFKNPQVKMLSFSMHDEQIYAERALRAGARGYLMKHEPTEVLLLAIRTVLAGKFYLSPPMSDRLLGKLVGASSTPTATSAIDSLSDRELEVLQFLGQGLTTSKIADRLCLSVKTVETYREHLKKKLQLGSGPELLRYAIEWSLSQVV